MAAPARTPHRVAWATTSTVVELTGRVSSSSPTRDLRRLSVGVPLQFATPDKPGQQCTGLCYPCARVRGVAIRVVPGLNRPGV